MLATMFGGVVLLGAILMMAPARNRAEPAPTASPEPPTSTVAAVPPALAAPVPNKHEFRPLDRHPTLPPIAPPPATASPIAQAAPPAGEPTPLPPVEAKIGLLRGIRNVVSWIPRIPDGGLSGGK